MAIDNKKEIYKDCPFTSNGEVLLERQYDKDGKLVCLVTATVEKVKEMKNKTDEELKVLGWDKYKEILAEFSE